MSSSTNAAKKGNGGDKEQPPHLLTIAQELRDLIYEHLIIVRGGLLHDRHDFGLPTDEEVRHACATYRALSMTCRQLYNETSHSSSNT
jgi:hypothetical protein